MPLTYRIDLKRGCVMERWSGDVTIAAVSAHWETMLSDPVALRLGRSVVELSDMRHRFTGSEVVHAVAELLVKLQGVPWKVAIVAPRPHQFGAARQFQTIAEPHLSTEIFADADAALAWLQEKWQGRSAEAAERGRQEVTSRKRSGASIAQ